MNQIRNTATVREFSGTVAKDSSQVVTIDGIGYENLTVLVSGTAHESADPSTITILGSDEANANFVPLQDASTVSFVGGNIYRRDITLVGKKRYVRVTIATDDGDNDAFVGQVIAIKSDPETSFPATAAGLLGSPTANYGAL